MADGGTLFLDEIGELPLELQPKLLRVLQDRQFERLGENKTLNINVRLVAATNRNLAEMVKKGEFRSDLYYRLNVFPIPVPPLRERKEDIPALARHFAAKFTRQLQKHIHTIPDAAMKVLTNWHWPGNVRERKNPRTSRNSIPWFRVGDTSNELWHRQQSHGKTHLRLR